MAPTPSKMAKIDGKLWINEDRLFMEKVFYLNKSTTKYLIVGNEASNFESVVKICDRATGTYITVKKENFPSFMRVVASILAHQYSLESGVIPGSGDISRIKFSHTSNGIWKLTHVDLPHSSILIHQTSFQTLERISRLAIARLLSPYESEICKEVIEDLRSRTFGQTKHEIVEELYSELTNYTSTCYEHQVITDLIANIESYVRLSTFAEGFYFRSHYKPEE